MAPAEQRVAGSFRDPSGFLFWRQGELLRQVNESYRDNYELLTGSGLASDLQSEGLLIGHEECQAPAAGPGAYKVLRPQRIPFVSYPYEWCFGQLKDAALLTLQVQKKALARNLSLKDASAFNVQFWQGRPVLIDTLSFERYPEGRPWVAYRQFCQHFLAPLALMAHRDARLGQLAQLHLDGVPLDLAAALLPGRTRLRFSLLAHIHLHARSQRRYADRPRAIPRRGFSRFAMLALLDSLETAVRRLQWQPQGTAWAEYYDLTNYSGQAFAAKRRLVAAVLDPLRPRQVWDIGANIGEFSRLFSARGVPTVAMDMDLAAVEKNYRRCRDERDAYLLPLRVDATQPTPAIGWENEERLSLLQRGPADLVLALALVHHLAIGNNLPLQRIARFFCDVSRVLAIEFVPKSDSQVQRLLATREDVFPDYHEEGFAREFSRYFRIESREAIPGTQRVLFRMQRRDGLPPEGSGGLEP